MTRPFILSLIAAWGATLPAAAGPAVPAMPASSPAAVKVELELTERLRSGEAEVGRRVRFRVAADVSGPGGLLLVRQGTLALGTVTESRGAGRFGRRGSLEVSIDHTTDVRGAVLPLRVPEGDGRIARWAAPGGGVTRKVASFFGGGRDIIIEPGTPVEAVLDLTAAAGAGAAPAVGAVGPQTLVLKNGDRITGIIRSREGGIYVVETRLGTLKVAASDVQEILGERAPATAPRDRFKVLD